MPEVTFYRYTKYTQGQPHCRKCGKRMKVLAGTDPFCPQHLGADAEIREILRESEVIYMS